MKKTGMILGVLFVLQTIVFCGTVRGQTKEVTVSYLRAAIGSLNNRAKIVMRAEYDAAAGLLEVTEIFLRGKGYSRFQVTEPGTGVLFEEMYCTQDSKAFGKLLKTTKNTLFVFSGYRGRGARKGAAFIVTDVREIRTYGDASGKEPEPVPEPPKKFQIRLTDHASSNTTIITNVELGKPYNVLGSTVVVEEQPVDTGVIVVEP